MNPPANSSDVSAGGVPIFFKWVMLLTFVTSIVGSFTHILVWALANYPYYTIFYGNVWRLLTSGIVSSGLLSGLTSALILYFILPEVERNISTTITFCDFFISNAIVQIVYCLVWVLLFISYSDEDEATALYSSGLWVIWMVYIVRICMSDPRGNIQLCCLPVTIKKQLYPLIILVLVGLMSWSIPYDLITAYLLTAIQCAFFDGSFVKFSRSTYRRIEMSCLLRWMSLRDDFVALDLAPKSKFFCTDEPHDYKGFYGSFMGRNLAIDQPQAQTQQALPTAASVVPTFGDMGPGVSLSANIKSVVTLDDVRNHWAKKTETPPGSIEVQHTIDEEPEPDHNSKQAGYDKFDNET